MRAVEYDRFGGPDVLALRDVPAPVPRAGEVLVRVRAAALNPKDLFTTRGKFRLLSGRRFPRRVGWDWSGEVVELGPGVHGVRLGEPRFGFIQAWSAGACAELAAVRVDESAPKPASLSFEEAAALPLVSLTALQALRDVARARPGQRVLVHGASGGVGVHAIQIAKALGLHVTTTSSARNLELCRSLGADETLDYAAADPLTGARARFDVVFDVFGNRRFDEAAPALSPAGTYVTTVPSARIGVDVARTLVGGRRARLVVVRSRTRDHEEISALVARGALRPVIERAFALDEIAAAFEVLATKRARGKIVVRVQ